MFKNLIVYRLGPEGPASMADIEAALDRDRFIECGLTQPLSLGWVEPRGVANAPLIEVVDGQWLLSLQVEQRILPGAVVRRRAEELAAKVEQATGRKPGKKQMRELKDQATLDLLPMSFTKRATVRLWIAPAQRLLMVDAGSSARADLALTQLAKSLVGVSAQGIQTQLSPAVAMAEWLSSGEPPQGFSVDRDCELKAADGEKPTVRYARHALDIVEIREHLKGGKQPTRLALTWQGRVSFTLTDGLQIKKLAFLDGVFEGRKSGRDDEAFDADAAIATGELAPLIGDLLDALGGEQVMAA
ncbi:recombination-associated protein RdgC [Ideonella sp. A 288]|uniref:recombination-associated protein RdgC n=1 Tax=Ideonella sp. A 288 TaxID=1962181 RepID=UPI000B4BD325|nr:recombination-associated protein RdgC [Ideonella sp. A 288]